MGNNKSRMGQYFAEELVNERLKNNKLLLESFRNYQNNGIIGLRSFSHLIRMPGNVEFSQALFNLFKSRKEGLTFSDYKIFYLVFTSKQPTDKINCLSELIFEDNDVINKEAYLNKVLFYFKKSKFEPLFKEDGFIKEFIVIKEKEKTIEKAKGTEENKDPKDSQKEKEREVFCLKEAFVRACDQIYRGVFASFSFLNPILSASDENDPGDRKKMSLCYNYACQCYLTHQAKKDNKENEDRLLVEYDNMRNTFENIAYKHDGTFPIQLLKSYFTKVNVKEELQSVIITYLHNMTLRPFIDFITFKAFMIQCTKGTDDLFELLFEMVFYPAKEGPSNSIEKALNIQLLSQSRNELVKVEDALNYKAELGEYILSLDNINLVPYALFRLKPSTPIQLNKVIEFLMMKLPWEDYLIEQIDKESVFFVINSFFWTAIEPSMSQDQLPKAIENKPLTVNSHGAYLADSSVSYKDSFIILPESLYSYFKKWFEIDIEIVLTKTARRRDSQKEDKDSPDKKLKVVEQNSTVLNKGDYLLITKGEVDYEIDLYYVHVDVFSLKSIYEELEGKKNLSDKCKEMLSWKYQKQIEKMRENKKEGGRQYPCRTLFSTLREQLKKYSPDPVKLYAYQNNQLVPVSDESYFAKEGIKGYCLLLLDWKNEDVYYYDVINPPKSKGKTSSSDKAKAEKLIEPKASSETEPPSTIKSSSVSSSAASDSESQLPLGLGNMGNTCYFNSVLQIFLNLPILNELLHSPKLAYFINKNNKFGQQGKFIKQYYSIVTRRETPGIPFKKYMNSVAAFKKLAGSINEQFNNFDQQDANEFLIFLLETFHEELNIKNKREYLENPPQLDNTDNELSNLNFANTIRRGASFIDALFLFQLKSNLTCTKCDKAKIVFETNYILDIPVMVDTMIEVEVVLYRLPFELKVYYDRVNEEFNDYNCKNKDKSISENLKAYSEGLVEDNNLPPDKYYLSARNTNVPISFKLKCDRTASAESLLRRIRLIKTLELEPLGDNKVINEEEESKMSKTTCNELTSLVIYRTNGTKVSMETVIDDCFPSEQKRCVVQEHLNTNGLNLLMSLPYELNLVRHKAKGKIQAFEDYRKKQFIQADCLCVSDSLSYYSKPEVQEKAFNSNLRMEYIVDIEHYHISPNQMSPFGIFYLNQMRINRQWIIINNSGKVKATTLYDIIWESNKRVLKSFRKDDKELWWRNSKEGKQIEGFSIKKMCYPFILRFCVIESQMAKCSKCPWYSFCPGCLINPFYDSFLLIPSNSTIVVDWCDEIVQAEFVQSYANICYSFKEDNVKVEGESIKRDHTLDDCFALFCEKEKLEDQIYCDKCCSHQYFVKNYNLWKPPPILIISLKRFKFNQHARYKIRTFINYPFRGMVIKGEEYDLYGVINHHGSITGGHYTSLVKVKENWLNFDDSHVSLISERQVLTESAYLLIYISVKSPKDKSYYHRLYSILDNIEDKDIPNVIMDNCFFFGEPVITPYGRGYCMETIEDDDNRLIIPIKYVFGMGFVSRKNVKKETVIEIKPKEANEDDEEADDEAVEAENQAKGEESKRRRRQRKGKLGDCIVF